MATYTWQKIKTYLFLHFHKPFCTVLIMVEGPTGLLFLKPESQSIVQKQKQKSSHVCSEVMLHLSKKSCSHQSIMKIYWWHLKMLKHKFCFKRYLTHVISPMAYAPKLINFMGYCLKHSLDFLNRICWIYTHLHIVNFT